MVDIEIRILPRREEGYPVEITLDDDQIYTGSYLTADITSWDLNDTSLEDGGRLFQALFDGDSAKAAWSAAQQRAADRQLERRVRLRIDLGASELHTLPWELLWSDEEKTLVAANAGTPFSRFLPIALPWRGAVEEDTIRILVVISNPTDIKDKYNLEPLDIEQEQTTLEAIVADINEHTSDNELLYKLELTFLDPPVTLEHLEEALREDYHILHYLGHGIFNQRRGQAALYLQDEAGNTQVMLDEALVYTVARQDTRPQLIFLAACQSAARSTADAYLGLAPKFIEVGVPAVVAMQDYVSLESARKLNGTFYRRLVRHGQIDKAINEARSTLISAGRPDAAVPVLLTRLRSGSIWQGEADARGTVLGDKPRIFWSGLINNIKRGRCTPIIGPRARGRWLPNPTEIARDLALEHHYPFANKDDPSGVMRYMASSLGEDFPRYELLEELIESFKERLPEGLKPDSDCETLTELVQAVEWRNLTADDPNEIHRVMASLDLPLYLTTNYDNFMTEALMVQGKKPTRQICRWNQDLDWLPSRFDDDPDYEPTVEEPLVYHLFGNDTEVDSLVLTENNHMDFVVNVVSELERIHPYIRAALTNTSLMFLGYSLEDWGFRVIMRGLVAPLQRRRRLKHVGVQLEPGNVPEKDIAAVHEFLKAYFQDDNINVFLGTVQQFVAELREHWEDK